MPTPRPHILVVCGRNKRRSKTAETLFRGDARYDVQGAGLSPRSPRRVREDLLTWADAVLVMEDAHKARIREQYRDLDLPPIAVLHIDDVYAYLQPELVEELEVAVPDAVRRVLGA